MEFYPTNEYREVTLQVGLNSVQLGNTDKLFSDGLEEDEYIYFDDSKGFCYEDGCVIGGTYDQTLKVFCPSYLDTYMTYDTECDPISFCKFVMENLEEKVRDNEGLPIPMIVIYTNLDDLVKITVIENYIKEMENEKLVGNVVFMTR